jgi:hypothetical protein
VMAISALRSASAGDIPMMKMVEDGYGIELLLLVALFGATLDDVELLDLGEERASRLEGGFIGVGQEIDAVERVDVDHVEQHAGYSHVCMEEVVVVTMAVGQSLLLRSRSRLMCTPWYCLALRVIMVMKLSNVSCGPGRRAS